jgi:hypothetical protein
MHGSKMLGKESVRARFLKGSWRTSQGQYGDIGGRAEVRRSYIISPLDNIFI